jgi:outer membrane protein assembly factor BamB
MRKGYNSNMKRTIIALVVVLLFLVKITTYLDSPYKAHAVDNEEVQVFPEYKWSLKDAKIIGIYENRLFSINDEQDQLLATNLFSGETEWQKEISNPLSLVHLTDSGLICYINSDGEIVSIEDNGETLWIKDIGKDIQDDVWFCTYTNNENIYISYNNTLEKISSLFVLRLIDGHIIWDNEIDRVGFFPAYVIDNYSYWSTGSQLLAFDTQGDLEWEFNISSGRFFQMYHCNHIQGNIYLPVLQCNPYEWMLYVIDYSKGELLHIYRNLCSLFGYLAFDNRLICDHDNGYVSIFDKSTYEEVCSVDALIGLSCDIQIDKPILRSIKSDEENILLDIDTSSCEIKTAYHFPDIIDIYATLVMNNCRYFFIESDDKVACYSYCIQMENNTDDISLSFQIDRESYYLNDNIGYMDVSPTVINDRTLLPARYVVEPLGGDVAWDEQEKKVTCILGDVTIEMWIDNPIAKVNGEEVQIDPHNPEVTPTIINDRTMVPMRFLAESLGCQTEWDAESKEIILTYSP